MIKHSSEKKEVDQKKLSQIHRKLSRVDKQLQKMEMKLSALSQDSIVAEERKVKEAHV